MHKNGNTDMNTYWDPVGVLLTDFLALSLPLLENVVFFVLKLHCVDGTRKTREEERTKLVANDVALLMNGNNRETTAIQTQ